MGDFTLDDFIRVNKATYELHSDIIFIKDHELRYKYINPAYKQISSLNADQLMGRMFSEVSQGELSQNAENVDRKAIKNRVSITYTRKLEGPEVKDQYYLFTKTPILNENQEVTFDIKQGLRGLVSARNIDEQVSISNELEKNLNLIETLLDAVPYPIFIKDLDGVYIKINNAYAMNLNMSIDEIVGKTDIELYGEKIENEILRS